MLISCLCVNAYAVVLALDQGINWISTETGEPLYPVEETVTAEEIQAKKAEVESRYGIKITILRDTSLTNQYN